MNYSSINYSVDIIKNLMEYNENSKKLYISIGTLNALDRITNKIISAEQEEINKSDILDIIKEEKERALKIMTN